MHTSPRALASVALVALLFAAMPAHAETAISAAANASVSASTTSTSADARASVKARAGAATTDAIRTRAKQEIQRRSDSLNKLLTRLNSAKRISADEKASLAASTQGQIQSLTSLQTKIDGDTDTDALKSDIKSITASYRIYMLVIPQGLIATAADRIDTVAAQMADLSTKMSARLSQLAGSHDVSAQQSALADLNEKVSDAQLQASTAVALIADLKPDNGDKTLAQSNTTAVQNARAKIKTATADLKAAYADAKSIRSGITSAEGSAHANASASTTTQ